ncbi:unnamed protein product, partial [Cladocopium goreaui]
MPRHSSHFPAMPIRAGDPDGSLQRRVSAAWDGDAANGRRGQPRWATREREEVAGVTAVMTQLRPSLAEQIRRATWVAESEELSTQRRQLQEDLSLVKDLMAQQQQQQVQSLEDLWQLQVSMERTTLKADAAEQEQQRVAQALRGEMTLCREGQQDLARQLLAKMAELNQKLGANMAQLEDEVTRREHEAEDTRRSHFEALQQECREALQEGRLAGKKAEACEEELAEKTKSVAAEVKRHFSAVVETRAAVTAMRRELQGQQVCSGCKELQNDLKQIGAWSTWLTEILGLPGWPAGREPEPYEAPWTSQLAQQQEELKKHDAELQSQRTLLENLLTQMKEVKTSEQQRQASTEAMEAMAAKQSSSLHSLRQKLAKERKDEAARRASCEEEFSKLRGQIEQDLLDLRKAQAENSVAQAAAVEEKQQALLRHCRAWASDASEVAKDALDERMQQVPGKLDQRDFVPPVMPRQNRKNLNRRPGRPSSPLRRKSAPVPEPAEPPRKKSGPKDVDVDDGSGGFWESDPVTPVAHANVNAGDVTADVNVNAHPNFCQRYYCSTACQVKDWNLGHKGDCGLADLDMSTPVPRPPLRLLAESVERPVHSDASWRKILDSSDFGPKNGWPRGLRNVANCCYMNALLQSLYHSVPLLHGALKQHSCERWCPDLGRQSADPAPAPPCFRCNLAALSESHLANDAAREIETDWKLEDVVELHSLKAEQLNGKTGMVTEILPTSEGQEARLGVLLPGKASPLSIKTQNMRFLYNRTEVPLPPYEVLRWLPRLSEEFTFGAQEDAHEFFNSLLRLLEDEELKEHAGRLQDSSEALEPNADLTALPSRIFGGLLVSQCTCTRRECATSSFSFEPFRDLSLEITEATQTLDDMLKLFTAPERLDKQNSWKCEACSEVVRARKQMMIYQAPNFLVLHLKRFRFMERGKVVKIVPFPPVLNLRPYLCKGAQGEGRPVNYDLRAVIVHVDKAGYSHFGHYIAFVKGATHRKGVFRWFLIDDSIIQEVEEEFVLRQQAYLLFYIRISGGSE